MAYETKKQQRERFIAEFLRRLREAPPGALGDVFKDADVVSIDELRAAREAALPPSTAGESHMQNELGIAALFSSTCSKGDSVLFAFRFPHAIALPSTGGKL